MRESLIFGGGGQQGTLLAEFIDSKGKYFQAHKVIRGESLTNGGGYFFPNVEMTDKDEIFRLIEMVRPEEIYNLAAMNSVAESYLRPTLTMDINCGGFSRILESVLCIENYNPKIYMALSSEMYGDPVESSQNENTPFNPRSPYGVSKVAAHSLAKVYRQKYGLKIYCGILFNNESQYRGEEFLSRKVCKYVASVYNGNKEKLKLGNLEARRDFGYAKDYVEWTWRIMQHETPDDFVLATGITHSVGEFVKTAFRHIGIDNWRDYIHVDQSLYRPSEGKLLVGDASKSKRLLNFSPKTTFEELISIMMEHELKQYDK